MTNQQKERVVFPKSWENALWRIAQSNQRPGHIAYLTKQEIASIARQALLNTGCTDPWKV